MASSQGTQPSKMNERETTLAFTEALPELWDTENRHYNNRVKKANKQQTTALFLSTTLVTRTRHKELTKKTDKPDGKLVLCQRTFSSVFCAVFLHS
jgi:hypothetical protein